MNHFVQCRRQSRGRFAALWPLWCVISLVVLASLWPTSGLDINLLLRSSPPSFSHPFGTDWLGRDMLTRSLKGLQTSLCFASLAVIISCILALVMAMLAMLNHWVRKFIELLVDVSLSLPHLLLLILLSLAFGGSSTGLVAAIALSHWPRLTRLLLYDMQGIVNTTYFQLAFQFGQSRLRVFCRHLIPHLIPQWLTGAVLMLPFALSHMAALTFLGFGFDPATPSMGVILSQASRYLLVGDWWLAVFPGSLLLMSLLLLSTVANRISENLRGREKTEQGGTVREKSKQARSERKSCSDNGLERPNQAASLESSQMGESSC